MALSASNKAIWATQKGFIAIVKAVNKLTTYITKVCLFSFNVIVAKFFY